MFVKQQCGASPDQDAQDIETCCASGWLAGRGFVTRVAASLVLEFKVFAGLHQGPEVDVRRRACTMADSEATQNQRMCVRWLAQETRPKT